MDPRKKTTITPAIPQGEPTVKVKVRPGGRYTVGDPQTGERQTYTGGDDLVVSAREYNLARHTLVTPEDAATETAKSAEASKGEDHTALFRAFRHRARAAEQQRRAALQAKKLQDFRELAPLLVEAGWTPPAPARK
jgi:hypothetical protein